MNEKKHISENLRFLEDKIKRLKKESKFRSWEIRGHKIVIENKRSLLGQRSKESAAIREEISQKEQELEKACNTTQREKVNKSSGVTLLKNKILALNSRLEIVDEADTVQDMQVFARQQWEKRARNLGIITDPSKKM